MIYTDQVKAMIPYRCNLLNPFQINVDEGEDPG
jgi:hypothetical protein